jgi:hypothetical protein
MRLRRTGDAGTATPLKTGRKPKPRPEDDQSALADNARLRQRVAVLETQNAGLRRDLAAMPNRVEPPLIDPATVTLSQRNQAHLRQMERRLEREHQARLLAIEETVRQRVVERNAAYVARVHEREQAARRLEEAYRRMIGNRNHPFTSEQFTAIRRCLHPDSRDAVSVERLQEAFTLFNQKKLQLTGRE